MRFDEGDVREAYRQGAKDAYECVAGALKGAHGRELRQWLAELEAWNDSDPPPPPLPPQV